MREQVNAEKGQRHTSYAMKLPNFSELSCEEGHSSARKDIVPEGLEDAVRAAMESCPEEASEIWDVWEVGSFKQRKS